MKKYKILATSAIAMAGCCLSSQLLVNDSFATAAGPDCEADYVYCEEHVGKENDAKAVNPVFTNYDLALCALDTFNHKVKTNGTNTTLSDAELGQITDIYCNLPGAGNSADGIYSMFKKMPGLETIKIDLPGANNITLESDAFSQMANLRSVSFYGNINRYKKLDFSSNSKLESISDDLLVTTVMGDYLEEGEKLTIILPANGKIAKLGAFGNDVDIIINGATKVVDPGSAMPLTVDMEKVPFIKYVDTLVYGIFDGEETHELSYDYDEINNRIILTGVYQNEYDKDDVREMRIILNGNSDTEKDNDAEQGEGVGSTDQIDDPADIPTTGSDILEGENQEMNAKEIKDLVIRYDRDVALFNELKIDGKVVPEGKYAVKSGSTIVTIKADYLKNLEAGEHKVSAYFEGEEEPIETNFTITVKTGNTGLVSEGNGSLSTIITMFIVLPVASIFTYLILGAKKRHNRKMSF